MIVWSYSSGTQLIHCLVLPESVKTATVFCFTNTAFERTRPRGRKQDDDKLISVQGQCLQLHLCNKVFILIVNKLNQQPEDRMRKRAKLITSRWHSLSDIWWKWPFCFFSNIRTRQLNLNQVNAIKQVDHWELLKLVQKLVTITSSLLNHNHVYL